MLSRRAKFIEERAISNLGLQRKTFIASLIVMFALVSSAVGLEGRLNQAQALEELGFTRGSFLDRNGRVLASTVDIGGSPVRRYIMNTITPWLGFRVPSAGWRGLEAVYNRELSAFTGTSIWSPVFDHLAGEPGRGWNVRLTVDDRLQQIADRSLASHPGAIVALDPSTGAILAMASGPTCPIQAIQSRKGYRACVRARLRPLLDRAVSRPIAPGSIFKIVTLTAALDTGAFRLTDVFSGPNAFGPSPYFDNTAYPSNVTRTDLKALTLEQALAFSDNFTFSHIGLTLGKTKLLHYAHRFGIGKRLPFELPVTASTIAHGHTALSPSELAQASFGAPVDAVTPLQMAMVVSAIANRGVLMAPFVVRDVETNAGAVIRRTIPHEMRRVMARSTAALITTAMRFVVDFGSGLYAKIPGIPVAGKTGTADSGSKLPNAWFIAFAPANHPVIAVAVLREFSGEGADYAAPIARRIMVAALRDRRFRCPH